MYAGVLTALRAIQSNPIQSNPIQSNPIQSNPIQSNPIQYIRAGLQLVPWIKTTVLVHASFLMTIPNINDTLGSLYQLLDSRLSVFPTLLALNGRMDLMLAQACRRARENMPLFFPAFFFLNTCSRTMISSSINKSALKL
jgi:hypothetical protein